LKKNAQISTSKIVQSKNVKMKRLNSKYFLSNGITYFC
jgi:hypothetical protein